MKKPGEGVKWDLARLAEVRAGIYHILARAFYIPDEETTAPEFLQDLAEIAALLNGGGEAVLTAGGENSPVEIKVDFTKLFHGPGKLLAPPYECLYRDGKLVMGNSTIAVIGFYREAGYEIAEQYTNLPDHISAELEFMAHLCRQEAAARRGDGETDRWLNLQRRFYQEHMGIWVKAFCRGTEENAQTAYYRGLAKLLEDWTASETALLAELA